MMAPPPPLESETVAEGGLRGWLAWAAGRVGIPVELVLGAGTHTLSDGLIVDAEMGASELTLRAAPGAA